MLDAGLFIHSTDIEVLLARLTDERHQLATLTRELAQARGENGSLWKAAENARLLLYRLSKNPTQFTGDEIRAALVRWGLTGSALRNPKIQAARRILATPGDGAEEEGRDG